ncbi:MAG: glycosyltransferase family A protein [Acidimicrobiales bacterium]
MTERQGPADPPDAATVPVPASIAVYVCTYQRNDELARLLDSLEVAAERVSPTTATGVVVVDDNPDGRARRVVEESTRSFPLGLGYRHAGSQNISIARNTGLDAAMEIADWVAMTDDDCVVDPDWLVELVAAQVRHGADAVTGPLLRAYPADAPSWLTDEPFEVDSVLVDADTDHPTALCGTNNSMVSTRLLRAHPDIRFDPALGTIGGEDMVFFSALNDAGMNAVYTPRAVVNDVITAERCTLRFQLGRSMWLGNSMAVTTTRTGEAGPARIALRAVKRIWTGLTHPVRRVLARESPQVRFAASRVAIGLGQLVGAVGVTMRHH